MSEAVKAPEWHEQRAKGIGGSDAAVLAGSPWKTPYQLWLEKTHRVRDDKQGEAMYWGTVLEEPIARRFAEVTGHTIRRQPLLQHKEHEWMLANVDRQICNDPRGPGILEVKTSNAFGGVVGSEDDLPNHYYAQLQHYLMITGYTWGAFAFLIGGQTFRHFEVAANPEYQAELFEAERRFWELVQTDTPPALTAGDDETLKTLYPTDNGISITLNDTDLVAVAAELVEVRAQLKTMEESEKLLKATLQSEMGDASEAIIPGWGKLTWKCTKPVTREKVDTDLLKSEYPAAAAACVKTETNPGARRFMIYPGKA